MSEEEERDLDMEDIESGDDEIDVGTNESDTGCINYNAVAGIHNDHHFGSFSTIQQSSSLSTNSTLINGNNLNGSMSEADRKRAHHNALERKRRDHIKDSFHALRDAIPSIKGEKTSRAQILKAATEYIRLMRNRNNDYQKDIDSLKKQNNDIEVQIRQLEKAKAASHFAKQSSNELILNSQLNEDSLKTKRYKLEKQDFL